MNFYSFRIDYLSIITVFISSLDPVDVAVDGDVNAVVIFAFRSNLIN